MSVPLSPVRRPGSAHVLVGVLFLVVGLGGLTIAQVAQGGEPLAFRSDIPGDVPTVRFPELDRAALLAEDEAEAKVGLPFRFGYPFEIDLGPHNAGQWVELPDGGRVWRLRLECPGAYSINLLYSDFNLPKGARLFVHDDELRTVLGAFTSVNHLPEGDFATGFTRGGSCRLELFEPPGVTGVSRLRVSRVVHGYRDLFFGRTDKGFGDSGLCNINVACPQGDAWRDQIRSVVLLVVGGSRICSGAMVNNVRGDGAPYLLTARHCRPSADVSNMMAMFNYQSPTCTPNANGPTDQTVVGMSRVAQNADSDFLLLRLNERPPPQYNVFYSGWSNVNTPAPRAVGIHHPSGDVKKISFEDDPLVSSDYRPWPYLPDSHWEVTSWNAGTTEGGSSGSPLYDPAGRIVGQLHGGWASCFDLRGDFYGKFSMSWGRGDDPNTRLRDWLDPDTTGATVLDGVNLNDLGFPEVTVTHPANGAVYSGPVPFWAEATAEEGIQRVDFFIDDQLVLSDTEPPYGFFWPPGAADQGGHRFRAEAVANGGGRTSDQVTAAYLPDGFAVQVVDLGSSFASGEALAAAVTAAGWPAMLTDQLFPVDPVIYPAVFVCLGYYPSNWELTEQEGQWLLDYVNAGGRLYLEGGDTWYWDDETPVHAVFGIASDNDGASMSNLGMVVGAAGGLAAGLSFVAEGQASYVDHLTPEGGSQLIWTSAGMGGVGVGVARDTGTTRTIGTSFEFGHTPAGSRDAVMARYLDFFEVQLVALPGNLNADRVVDAVDMLIFAHWLADRLPAGAFPWRRADLNRDGRVDALDLVLLQRQTVE